MRIVIFVFEHVLCGDLADVRVRNINVVRSRSAQCSSWCSLNCLCHGYGCFRNVSSNDPSTRAGASYSAKRHPELSSQFLREGARCYTGTSSLYRRWRRWRSCSYLGGGGHWRGGDCRCGSRRRGSGRGCCWRRCCSSERKVLKRSRQRAVFDQDRHWRAHLHVLRPFRHQNFCEEAIIHDLVIHRCFICLHFSYNIACCNFLTFLLLPGS
mmetsp:Transcript_62354/g.103712  ORF Transcript_62354/g.103712 Transcript_62354/m.103712 type:complete len:211 (-) Transcript_62354:136-768(-)